MAALLCALSGGPDRHEPPLLMTRALDGGAADGRSGVHGLDLDAAGRLLVFDSDAGDLVDGDDNRQQDVFLIRVDDGNIQCLSQGLDGTDANGASRTPSLSADGRFVVYSTNATNVLPGKSTPVGDIVLTELGTRRVSRVSAGLDGSEGNGTSSLPDLSADGRFIVYQSWADNLVAGDTNAACDIFLFDRIEGTTIRLSEPRAGGEADGSSTHPALSGDGRFVSFSSEATNLVPGDTNGVADIFVVNCQSGAIERVNLGPEGQQADAAGGLFPDSSLSHDGRFVAYSSMASTLVELPAPPLVEQVYVTDRKTGTTQRISCSTAGDAADDTCFGPTLSADGRFVGFESRARNLLSTDRDTVYDAYVADLRTGSVRRVSSARLESGQRDDCGRVAISPDGSTVAFSSRASDLTEADDNDASDVYLLQL